MNQKIELTRLWAKTDPKTGLQTLAGKFGFNARIRIEELPEPDERGATHALFILPPYVPRDDGGNGYATQGNGSAPTGTAQPQQAPRQLEPARRPAPAPAPRPSSPAFGFADDDGADE